MEVICVKSIKATEKEIRNEINLLKEELKEAEAQKVLAEDDVQEAIEDIIGIEEKIEDEKDKLKKLKRKSCCS